MTEAVKVTLRSDEHRADYHLPGADHGGVVKALKGVGFEALKGVGFDDACDSSDPKCKGGTVLVRPVSFPGAPPAIYCLPGSDRDEIVDTLTTAGFCPGPDPQ